MEKEQLIAALKKELVEVTDSVMEKKGSLNPNDEPEKNFEAFRRVIKYLKEKK